jgi:hypothetical protein
MSESPIGNWQRRVRSALADITLTYTINTIVACPADGIMHKFNVSENHLCKVVIILSKIAHPDGCSYEVWPDYVNKQVCIKITPLEPA